MAIFTSYDMKGEKLSFANWISNLSPVDTFFVSVTGKEQIQNTKFHWQTDSLAAVDLNNAQKESDDTITIGTLKSTTEHDNVTQILRKAVEVTDTADALDNYGRQKELGYQMEKAGKEIKRDLEAIFLSDQTKVPGTANTTPRKTDCFKAQVSTTKDAITGAKVSATTADPKLTETELFDITYNLYLAGSDADIIMFHPSQAAFFSSLMDSGVDKGMIKMIENLDTTLNKFVGTLIDPLGQRYKLVPNRFMPEKEVYFFNPKDWTQMVLRAPEKVKLAKTGSSEKYMIEMEVGLRHRNPYASGVLTIKS